MGKRTGMLVRVLYLLLVLLLPWSFSAASAEPQVIKVGYFRVADYYKVDAAGNVTGYDTEYLKQIAKYANLRFEYVECGTWLKGAAMLKTGEIDLLGLSLKSLAREQEYEFCKNGYGYNVSEVVTKEDNPVGFQDFAAIGKMKLGARFNYVPLETLKRRLAAHGETPQILIYKTQQELIDALERGEVDAVATSSHLVAQKLRVLDKFEYTPFYFMLRKGNIALREKLDNALAEININDPTFDDTMLRRYFPTLNQYPLSKEEQDYINSLDSLTFAFCTNEGYLCRTEQGRYVGIHPAIAKKVCELLGVQYKEVQIDFPDLIKHLAAVEADKTKTAAQRLVELVKDKGVDVWGDFFYEQKWADTLGVGLTNPYLDASYYEIRTKGVAIPQVEARLAAVRGLRFTAAVAAEYVPEKIVWCDDFESCIKAVKEGRADVTVVNTYAAEYYLSMFKYNELSAQLLPYANKAAMAVVDPQRRLLISALEKKILALSAEEKRSLIQEETIKAPQQNVWEAFIYTRTQEAILLVAFLVALLVALGAMLYIIRRSKHQNAMLQKATNAKSEFLAKMSHDMRTPMNAIINLTSLIEEEIDQPEAVLADVKKIKITNEFLLALINDILDVERIERGKLLLQRQAYREEDFINYLHATFDEMCEQKSVLFTIKPSGLDKDLLVDRVRFNQLCFNLISNAVKYTPAGGKVDLRIAYQLQEAERILLDIYVEDTGIGMSQEFLKKAFEQFEQENRQFMSVEGVGLGLSIVQGIVSLMGGTIEIKSEVNQGTCVHVQLQLDTVAKQKLVEQQAAQLDYDVLKGKQILVVEDHEINRKLLTRLLESKGMEVLTAANGAEGVACFKEHAATLALVLMDIRMPVLNGLEAAKAIRALPQSEGQTVPILALTANAYQEDIDASLAAGMNAHLAKPIIPQTLYTTIIRFLKS